MARYRRIKKLLIWLLLFGIAAMILMRAGYEGAHRPSRMEPADPFEDTRQKVLDLSDVHPERTILVAVDGSIERMGLEEYVLGVLAAEMPASYSPEALKAQAVAARTLAVYKIVHGGCSKYAGADICSESGHCQAFHTDAQMRRKWDGHYAQYVDKLRQAVAATAGKIITFDDQPILVLFHASSAGRTEDVENVYAKALPYLRGVPSPGDAAVTELESQEEFDRKWFASTVNGALPSAGLQAATLEKQVSVASRFPSGRVKTVRLGGSSLSGVELRRLLDIRSANFSIAFNKRSVILTTEGYGHGVGMSQTGAEAMAREGSGYEDILTYYYTGVRITEMD